MMRCLLIIVYILFKLQCLLLFRVDNEVDNDVPSPVTPSLFMWDELVVYYKIKNSLKKQPQAVQQQTTMTTPTIKQ